MRTTTLIACILAASAMTACAGLPGAGKEPMGPPNFTPIAGKAPPAQARFYADCIAQAATSGAYVHADDGDSSLLLFTCTGATARAFYDGLAGRSARVGSEVVGDGRTFRSTNRVRKDLFGVDYCSTGGRDDYACVVTLNVGEFMRE